MAKKFATPIDLLQNELQNGRIQNLAADPASPVAGLIYYNTSTNAIRYYNGTGWVQLGYLNQQSATGAISVNNQLISSLATPVSDTDAATKGYVDALAQGLDAKPSVVVATTTNITLSAGQSIDGVAVVPGDRVLVKAQTAPAENGIYVVSATAWARADDCSTWAELVGAFTFVEKGTTGADTGWLCSVDAGGVLGTTAVTWVQFSAAGQIVGANLAGAGTLTNAQVYSGKTGNSLNFRTISNDTNAPVTLTQNTNDIRVGFSAANAHNSFGMAKYYTGTFAYVTSGTDITITHNLALPTSPYTQINIKVYETASYTEVEVDRSTTAWTANACVIKMYGGTVGAGYYTVVITG